MESDDDDYVVGDYDDNNEHDERDDVGVSDVDGDNDDDNGDDEIVVDDDADARLCAPFENNEWVFLDEGFRRVKIGINDVNIELGRNLKVEIKAVSSRLRKVCGVLRAKDAKHALSVRALASVFFSKDWLSFAIGGAYPLLCAYNLCKKSVISSHISSIVLD